MLLEEKRIFFCFAETKHEEIVKFPFVLGRVMRGLKMIKQSDYFDE